MINVVARPKPHSAELVTWRETPGQTIAEMLGGVLDDVEVFLGDGREALDVPLEELVTQWRVPHDRWHRVRPKAGVSLYAVKVSQDGDIMQIVAPIAIAALAFVAPYAAAWAAPSVFGASGSFALVGASGGLTFAGSAVSAAVGVLGSVAVNQLIQPQMPTPDGFGQQESFTQLASITGQGNRMNPFGVIPRLYGTHIIYPMIPITARPFTEFVGDQQVLRWKGVLGQGPLEIGGVKVGGPFGRITEDDALSGDPIKIGNSPITAYDGYELEIYDSKWSQYRNIYKDQVLENEVGARFDADDKPHKGSFTPDKWVYDDIAFIRTTAEDASEIGLDIVWQQGLFSVDVKGKTGGATVQFAISYREVGSSTWYQVGPGTDGLSTNNCWAENSQAGRFETEGKPRIQAYGDEREPHRMGLRWRVPRGQYEVQVYRVRTRTLFEQAVAIDCTWTVLRTYRDRVAFREPGVIVMDLRLPITDQIGGRLDQVSVVATSVLPYFDGTQWQSPGEPTDNPAWIYADIWTGPDSARPVDHARLNPQVLKAWADDCTAAGRGYNKVIDSGGTVLQRAREVAATGRAAFALHDNKISVVRDEANAEPLITVSPRNASDFQEVFTAPDLPHGLRVTFTDPNTWEKTERIVYRDGYNADGSGGKTAATKFETYETQGVIKADQAWQEGRTVLAERELRPVQQSFVQGLISIVYERGDAIELQYDVIGVGLHSGRIKTVTRDANGAVTAFETDERLFMKPGKSYGVKVQVWDPDTEAPALRLTTIQTDSSSVGVTDIALDSALSDVEVGAHFIFGEATRESATMKVLDVKRRKEHRARITVVPAAPEIQDAIDGEIPPWQPTITQPVDPAKLSPPAPRIRQVLSDESVLLVQPDGSLKVRMVVAYELAAAPVSFETVQLRYRKTDDGVPAKRWSYKTEGDLAAARLSIDSVQQGAEYELQLRAWAREPQTWSSWTAITRHTVVGKSTPPPDVNSASLTRRADGSHVLSISYPDVPPDYRALRVSIDGVRVGQVGGQPERFEIPPSWLRYPRRYRVVVQTVDTSGNVSPGLEIAYDRPAPPVIDELLTEELADGTRRFTWRYSQAPVDFAGVQLRAKVGRSYAWTNATPMHAGLLTDSPFETNAPRAGTWTVMARAVDTQGNVSRESAAAVLFLGDRLVDNVVDEFDCRADGWPGQIVNASVQPDGTLLADNTADAFWADWITPFWGDDDAPFWTGDQQPFWTADQQPFWTDDFDSFWSGTYPGITYTRWNLVPEFGGVLNVDFGGRGDADVLYRRQLPEPFWTDDEAPFWTGDDQPFWRPAQQFLRYTRPVKVGREPIDVRVTTPSAKVQAELRRLRVIVDAPDIVERFNDAAIAAGGTRLALTKPFRVIRNIQITLQDDGGAAAGARYADKAVDPGPMVEVTDKNGNLVSGSVDITIQGV